MNIGFFINVPVGLLWKEGMAGTSLYLALLIFCPDIAKPD